MRPTQSHRPRQELLDQKLLPAFKNGRNLRDYQVSSAQASAVGSHGDGACCSELTTDGIKP